MSQRFSANGRFPQALQESFGKEPESNGGNLAVWSALSLTLPGCKVGSPAPLPVQDFGMVLETLGKA